MRILHTADWHLGKTLEGRDRTAEQKQFIDELCQICIDECVDVVLMAGDVFQTVNPSAQAEELFYDALHRLSDDGNRAVVVIAGNHDNPERLRALMPLADRLGITIFGLPGDDMSPSLGMSMASVKRVAAGPSWLELALPNTPHHAIIAALPYPSEARLKEVLSAQMDDAPLLAGYNERIRQIFTDLSTHFRPDTVNVAMTHLFVRGGIESDSETQIQVGGTYAVDPNVFPKQAQYVGLGHLHRPQVVAGAPTMVRYSGSPLAYSFSEAGHAKSVVIVDVEPGGVADVKEIYLSAGKPLVRWVATEGLAQVYQWVAEGKDANAWIDLEIHVSASLSMNELQMLRTLHSGFVNIRPVFPEIAEQVRPSELRNLPLDQVFVRFFERQKGYTPEADLIRMFLEVAHGVEEEHLQVEGEEVAG